MRNLSQQEAEDFNELCRYVMISGNMSVIFDNGFNSLVEDESSEHYNSKSYNFIKEKGLNYTRNICPLIEAGLLSTDNSFYGEFEEENILTIGNKSIFCCIEAKDNKTPIVLQPYVLTTSGQELFRVIQSGKDFCADIDYQVCCFSEIKKIFPHLQYNLFRVIRNKEIENLEKIEL